MRRRQLLSMAGALALPLAARADAPVRIGTVAGPYAEILQHVAAQAARQGLDLRIEVRPDGRGIDADVARGRLDAASCEDGVRFADEARHGARGLAVVAATVTLPMAIYSRRLTRPLQVRDGETVVVPDDAPGLARALVLLHNFGLIGLRDDIGLHATLRDVIENPRSLHIVARPAHALYGALTQAAFVLMDSADARRAGLEPARDSIGIEDGRSPWAGVLAMRRDRMDEPWVARLLAAYRSEDTKHFLLAEYRDSVRRPW